MAAVYKYNSMNKSSVQIVRPNGLPAKQSDDFCWSCHRDKPTLFCTSCVRSYHAARFCSGSKKLSADEKRSWTCPICIDTQTDLERMHTKNIDAKDVSKMLSLVLERIKSDENFTDALLNIDYSQISQRVAKPMDLRAIEQNIDDFVYRCYEAFLSDIKWIVHNVKVCNQLVFYSKMNAAKIVKWLLDMTKEEIYSIRMCPQCYSGLVQSHRFDIVCKQPHLIVWAKQKGYPYWPGKLMSVNAAKNSVEVRYFGEKHFRAVVAPKDCFMYSTERPSLHLGTHRKAFEKAQSVSIKHGIVCLEFNDHLRGQFEHMKRVGEVDLYISQLIKVYGTFNVAVPNTPLNAKMLERHLFDTMPKAWIALGKTSIPPPIPKVVDVAAARISRRHSIASRSVIAATPQPAPSAIPPSTINAGRIMTRRLSSRLNSMNDDEHSEFDSVQKSRKVLQRRQSVQVDMLHSGKRNFWNDSDTHGVHTLSSSSTSRKRKISSDDDAASDSASGKDKTKQTTPKSANEPMFKVPEIPRKIRKLSSGAQDVAVHGSADPISPTGNKQKSAATNPTTCASPSNGQNDKQPNHICTHSTHPSEVDTFIEENTAKMTDSIRTIMSGMLHDFWNAAQPTQSELESVQNQLITMQTDYTRQIDEMKRENGSLKQKLNTMTGKCDAQMVKVRETMQKNAELRGNQTEAKLKMAALAMDLKKTTESNAELTGNLNQMRKQNDEYQSTIVKLKTQHESAQKLLIEAESKVTQLDADNKALNEKNTGLNMSLQWAVKQYQDALTRLKDVETKCNLEKNTAYEQCYRIINDNKKKQWCAVCQKQGGRYYCSSKCEDKYWK